MAAVKVPAKTQKLVQGIVIDVPKWPAPVQPKRGFLKRPEIAVKIGFDPKQDITNIMPDKQVKAFQKSFEKAFDKEFYSTSKQWFDEMQHFIDRTEDSFVELSKNAKDPKAAEAEIQAKTKQANDALEKILLAWQARMREIVQRIYLAAVEQSYVAMKKRVQRAQAKVWVRVVLVVGLTTVSGVASVVLKTVSSVAALGPFGIIPAVWNLVTTVWTGVNTAWREISRTWSMLERALDDVVLDTKKINDVIDKTDLVRKYKNEPLPAAKKAWDVYKAIMAQLQSSVKQLDSHIGQVDKYIAKENDTLRTGSVKIRELRKQIDSAQGPEGEKLKQEAATVEHAMDAATQTLMKIERVVRAGKEASANYKAKDVGNFLEGINKLADALAVVQKAGDQLKAAQPAMGMLGTAISSAIKVAT